MPLLLFSLSPQPPSTTSVAENLIPLSGACLVIWLFLWQSGAYLPSGSLRINPETSLFVFPLRLFKMFSLNPHSGNLTRLSCQYQRPALFSWSPLSVLDQLVLVAGDILFRLCFSKVRIGRPKTVTLPFFILYVALSKKSFFSGTIN